MKSILKLLQELNRSAFLSKKDLAELDPQSAAFIKSYLPELQATESIEDRKEQSEAFIQFLIKNNYILNQDASAAMSTLNPQKTYVYESQNASMQKVIETAKRVAPADTTVLLLGESGVGKSRLAKFIHEQSRRNPAPFITVSCGSIPETLLESELFGVEKGAYTGAVKSREGRFQKAHNGTLFLDEIGELSPSLQVKLLRAIQERKIEPLGSGTEITVDVRLIAATNRNLEKEVQNGNFREDLYFRLNVVPMTIPPLRDRPEEIEPLMRLFLDRFGAKHGRRVDIDDPGLIRDLKTYSWPGNIRELENCIERLCVLATDSRADRHDLPERIRPASLSPGPAYLNPPVQKTGKIQRLPDIQETEKNLIEVTLLRMKGNLQNTARSLGIHRNTLRLKMKQYGIQKPVN